MFEKIEGTGYRVGRRFAEHLSRDSDRLLTALEVMKFVAREVWNEVFGKPMSKLQTNNKVRVAKVAASSCWPAKQGASFHPFVPCILLFSVLQGVFLLQDSDFRWTRYVSGSPAEGETPALALKYCVFACGLIRGCLAAFDLAYLVNVDVSALPKVVFQARQVIPPSLQQQEQQRQLMAQQQQQP